MEAEQFRQGVYISINKGIPEINISFSCIQVGIFQYPRLATGECHVDTKYKNWLFFFKNFETIVTKSLFRALLS